MKDTKQTSSCCNADYEDNDKSYCCGAEISESGICMNLDCLDHAESEGYYCDECDEYFEETQDKIYKCGFCGYEIENTSLYCSKECFKADNTEGV
jgi:hypothetical protein